MKTELNIAPLSDWLETQKEPLVIAGPCSAETETQLMNTCELLAQTGKVSMLRAGIWKPRTRPGEFEGIGDIGLKWLVNVGKKTKLPVTVEVGNASHVEKALKWGISVLWIGARSTVNPFLVQEIADSLKGVDIPVMVKNPVNPDLQLWIGAFERLNKAGITKLAAIHRGFSSYEKSSFRNEPMWEIPIALKTHFPDLPMINDPSHITGNRDLVPFICQKALDMDMQGLMIESHEDPSIAWTDAKQQVTPASLSKIIDELILRKPDSDNPDFHHKLEELRKEIDKIDDQILAKMSQRMNITAKVGEYKRDHKVTILQVSRWDEIIRRRTEFAKILKLDEHFVEKLLELIHNESIRQQTMIMNSQNKI